MKKNITQKLFAALKSKGILAISGGLLAVSCGTQVSAYSETDGVYYDPNRDTMPEVVASRGNQVGDVYEYNDADIYDNVPYGNYDKKHKVWHDNGASASDWGNYAGTETFYSSWGDPFYGYFSPYWGSSFGMSFGWGSPWYGYGYSPYGLYSGYYGYYSPFYSGYYGSMFNYYSPYYGYYSPYGYGYGYPVYKTVPRRNSGADGVRMTQGTRSAASSVYNNNSGFRNSSADNYRRPIQYPSSSTQPGMRAQGVRRAPEMQQPRYRTNTENVNRNNNIYRNNDSGFRSGSDSGFRSGGFSGSSSSAGSARSGGGFRTGGR